MSISLPPNTEVSRILTLLLGKKIEMKPVAAGKSPKINALSKGWHASKLNDDQGQVLGALMTDLSATIFFGGSLMMMPPGGLEDMKDEGKASEEVIDATGEVFNNITTLLNQIEGNPHLRVTATTPIDAKLFNAEFSWIAKATSKLELSSSFPPLGEGNLCLFAK